MSTARTRTGPSCPNARRAAAPAPSAASGPLPGGSSRTAGRPDQPGPTSMTGSATAPSSAAARSTSRRPSTSIRALSRPMRRLAPPVSSRPATAPGRWGMDEVLAGVELHDHRLVDGDIDLLAHRHRPHRGGRRLAVALQPGGHDPVEGVDVVADGDHVGGFRSEGDDVAGPQPQRRDRHPLPVDRDQAVAHELPGLGPGAGPAAAVHDVVDPQLEVAEQVVAGDARAAGRLLVEPAELPLHDAVGVAELLLLPELEGVLRQTLPVAAVLTGRIGAGLEGPGALLVLVDVHAQTARDLDLGTGVASHKNRS